MNMNRILAFMLAPLLSLPGVQSAELAAGRPEQGSAPNSTQAQGAASQAPVAGAPKTLSVFVLQGNGAVNSIGSKSAAPIVIEVRDERSLPVDGAEVVVQLPQAGPSGFFPGAQLSWTGKTDASGQAVVSLTPNQNAGRFSIQVVATSAGRIGRTVITQTNSTKAASAEAGGQAKHSHTKTWIILGIVAAGAATGIAIWATHDSGSSQTSVGLQPGPIAIGAPR